LAERILNEYADHLPGGVTLVPGRGGIFEVTLGQQNLFSKASLNRFPEQGEVEDSLAKLFDAGS
jgi:selenoprotein W-related protein